MLELTGARRRMRAGWLCLLLTLGTTLAACESMPVKIDDESFPSAAVALDTIKARNAAGVAAVEPATDRFGGRVLIVLPDADRLRLVVGGTLPLLVLPSLKSIDFGIALDQLDQDAVVASVKRSNLFDSVTVTEASDTRNPDGTGYGYLLWHRVSHDSKGIWHARWILRPARSVGLEVAYDPGQPEPKRFAAMMKSIDALARLGPATIDRALGQAFVIESGLILDPQGDILALGGGIENCSEIDIRSRAGIQQAAIRAVDHDSDLALLHVDLAPGGRPVTFRDGSDIQPADPVIAIAYSFGHFLTADPTVTTGTIGSLVGLENDSRYLQFSAPIQGGSVGGAIVDFSGNVVGAIVGTLNRPTRSDSAGTLPENVNFGLKSAVIRKFLDGKAVVTAAAPSTAGRKPADIAEQVSPSVVEISCQR